MTHSQIRVGYSGNAAALMQVYIDKEPEMIEGDIEDA